MNNFQNVEEYINQFDYEIQNILRNFRLFIISNFPELEETISYAMPTYRLNGNLIHFAGYKNHLGFYPGPSGVINFLEKSDRYKTSKGAIQFPLNEPLPLEIIKEVIEFRIFENKSKIKNKSNV